MICDAPAGCGQNDTNNKIAFGERVNLTEVAPDLVLSTFVNVTEQPSTANITPLTHFAAAIAQQRGEVTSDSIATAHSEIADLFGLVGALHQMKPAMIEDSASLVDGNNSEDLRYALINAGIAHALFSDLSDENNALSTRLAEAITDIQATDGAFWPTQRMMMMPALSLTSATFLRVQSLPASSSSHLSRPILHWLTNSITSVSWKSYRLACIMKCSVLIHKAQIA
ncbi:hypothetical protein AC626_10745 [Pseudoalteromonas rubra]|uniref:Uncharacterized protein n=1 Tax=Pseudoalteromonas rubra TaxID=43658 RepID=A0A0L0EU95_9GAMM|nr:hypothetical protein AC626_10745 [Pseudoalteromonas rubra]